MVVAGLTFYVNDLRTQIGIDGGGSTIKQTDKNTQIVLFLDDFVNSVLDAPGEVDFEVRLRLENEVRETKDPQILEAWKAFTDSKTEQDAQRKVIDLLKILAFKLKT